jgi:hypothetical protein
MRLLLLKRQLMLRLRLMLMPLLPPPLKMLLMPWARVWVVLAVLQIMALVGA